MTYIKRAAAFAAVAAMLLIASASASAATSPGYEEFSDCPSKTVDPTVAICFRSVVDGGHLQMGNTDTPIVDPATLSGAVTTSNTFIVGSFDGGRQRVPGGIIGMTGLDWLVNLFPGNLLQLYAEPELAGAPTSPLNIVFSLPLKVRLENPLLSSNCYIGSDSNPIALNLTRATTAPPPPNTPITGNPGTTAPDPALPGVVRITNRVLVDNAFAAPPAQGCGFFGLGLIDSVVNAQAGLPSPAGTNEAVEHTDAAFAPVQAVYQPGGFE